MVDGTGAATNAAKTRAEQGDQADFDAAMKQAETNARARDTTKQQGGKADDFLTGGAGDDSLNGGEGDDTLFGGAGNDTLDGGWGGGFDTAVLQGRAADYEFTRAENGDYKARHLATGEVDTIRGIGTVKFDVEAPGIRHKIGNLVNKPDQSKAEPGTVKGDAGNNDLAATDAGDLVKGAAGNDTLRGGDGNDTLNGGLGDDVFHLGVGNDLAYGNEGNDRAVVQGRPEDYDIRRNANGAVILENKNTGDTSKVFGTEEFTFEGGGQFNTMSTEAMLQKFGSFDALADKGGATAAPGGQATDTDTPPTQTRPEDPVRPPQAPPAERQPQQGSTQTTINGRFYSETLRGTEFNDHMRGLMGNDVIFGGGGDDVMVGGSGNDTLVGGSGVDRAVLFGHSSQWVVNQVSGDSYQAINRVTGEVESLHGIELIEFSNGTYSLR